MLGAGLAPLAGASLLASAADATDPASLPDRAAPAAPAAQASRVAAPDDAHDCLVEPHVSADVGSSVQGIVARPLVELGETVVRGQPIAELESRVERAALDQAAVRAAMTRRVSAIR